MGATQPAGVGNSPAVVRHGATSLAARDLVTQRFPRLKPRVQAAKYGARKSRAHDRAAFGKILRRNAGPHAYLAPRVSNKSQAQIGMNGKDPAQLRLGLGIDESVAPARRNHREHPNGGS